jgi:hypothetical protein
MRVIIALGSNPRIQNSRSPRTRAAEERKNRVPLRYPLSPTTTRLASATALVASLLVILGAAKSARSQALSMSMVRIKTAARAGVSLAPYNPAVHAAFAQYLQGNPAQASLAPLAAVLQNRSGKTVVGLTLRWTWTDAAGREDEKNYWTDSLFSSRQPVIVNGDALLATPFFLVPQSMLTSGMIMRSGAMLTRGAAELSESSNVAVDLDVVIFQDGLVAGPDHYDTLAQIQARRKAAVQLSAPVLDMLRKGQDPSAMLAQAKAQPPVGPDLVAAFTSQLAMLFQHGDLRETAGTLSNLPNLAFHRQ